MTVRSFRLWIGGIVLVLGALTLSWSSSAAPGAASAAASEGVRGPTRTGLEALRTGNRQFRRGDAAAAVESYRSAGEEVLRREPLLAYNLATALHHVGRLPEAVLWYRRAALRQHDDRRLQENLAAARNALDAPRVPPRPGLAPFLLHPWLLPAAAAATAWAALLGVATAGLSARRTRWTPVLLVASVLLWCSHLGLERFGPRPAVLLEPCSEALPSGSEVWSSSRREPAGRSATDRKDPRGKGSGRRGERELVVVRGPEGWAECPAPAVASL